MSDDHGQPQPPAPHAWAAPPQPAVVPQVVEAGRAWIDGYQPGNPWQARLCLETPYGTVAYPLTPHTMPDLLEPLVLVAQEQQGLPVGLDAGPEPDDPHGAAEGEEQEPDGLAARLQSGRAARLTGWAVVHDLWEREDPSARIVMGAIVVGLLLLGIVLT